MSDGSSAWGTAVQQAWELLAEVPSLHERRGGALGFFARRRLQRARELVRPFAETHAAEEQMRWVLARSAHLAGEIETAALHYAAAVQATSPPAWLWHDYALCALALGQGEVADEAARAAVDLDPERDDFKVTYAKALVLAGHAKRALGVIANVCKKDPDDAAARLTIEMVRRVINGTLPAPTRFTAAD